MPRNYLAEKRSEDWVRPKPYSTMPVAPEAVPDTVHGQGMPPTPSMERYGKPTGIGEGIKLGLKHGAASLEESIGTATEYVGGKLGNETMMRWGQEAQAFWGDVAKDYESPEDIQGSVWENPSLMANPAWWAYSTADMAPSFAAAIIPGVGTSKYIKVGGSLLRLTPKVVHRLALLGGSIASGLVGGSLEGAGTYQTVLERGGSRDDAERSAEYMGLAASRTERHFLYGDDGP